MSGRPLEIFDLGAISEGLALEMAYEFLVAPLLLGPKFVRHLREAPTVSRANWWLGQIVDEDWQAPSSAFRLLNPEVSTRKWLVVDTVDGRVLIGRDALFRNAKITGPLRGSYVEWEENRFDLFGVR